MLNTIQHGDNKELIRDIPDHSVHLLITDPPYARDVCVEACEWLAEEAPRVLTPGGSLVVLIGQVTLPVVAHALAQTLQFRWPLCMAQLAGKHAQMRLSGVEVWWKLALWFTNGKLPNERRYQMNLIRDLVEVPVSGGGVTKANHEWEQSMEWSDYYVEQMTFEGETVLDPYCGSGTFPASAAKLGRNYIGFDIDPEAAATARQRIASLQHPLLTPRSE